MNKQLLFPVAALLTILVFDSCRISKPQQSGVIVSSDFDAGSIGELVQSGRDSLTGTTRHWKHRSSTDDQYYWFYFRLDSAAGRPVTILLKDLQGIYRGQPHLIYTQRTQPVYSYDQEHWERLTDVHYDSNAHTLLFRGSFVRSPVWIAYAHPYPFQKGNAFVETLPEHSPWLTREVLGMSAEKRPIRLLTITDPQLPAAKKKTVLITTLQHAGEDIGGFFIEGLIRFLLSADPDAELARKNTVFKIVPMMNPDGLFHGITRFNNNMEDLNQEWDDDYADTAHRPTEPEVLAVKTWIRNWLKNGHRIDLGLDVHSQGQQGEMNILHAPTDSLRGFVEKLNRYWPVEMIPMEFPGSANDCLTKEFHIPSGTFEIPQSSVNGTTYLKPEDYASYGRATAIAVSEYFR